VAKNGLNFHSSVFYQATLEDSQLRFWHTTIIFERNENLVQNQLFGADKTPYLKTNVQHLSNRSSSSAEKENVK
jgi:hypothetical protein